MTMASRRAKTVARHEGGKLALEHDGRGMRAVRLSAGFAPPWHLAWPPEAPTEPSKKEMAFRHVIDGQRIVACQCERVEMLAPNGAIRLRKTGRSTCSLARSTFCFAWQGPAVLHGVDGGISFSSAAAAGKSPAPLIGLRQRTEKRFRFRNLGKFGCWDKAIESTREQGMSVRRTAPGMIKSCQIESCA
jgi:hypothetical protein